MRDLLPIVILVLLSGLSCGPLDSESTAGGSDGGGGDAAPPICGEQHPELCDEDGDGFTPNQGDCDDFDPARYPGAEECNAEGNGDGMDTDCDGRTDEGCLDTDEDQDGFTVGAGDCDDTDPLVSPAAEEVPDNGRDDNCNGRVDEVAVGCDCDPLDPADVQSYVKALDLCGAVEAATMTGDPRSRGLFPGFGLYQARAPGCSVIILSTGVAGDQNPQGALGMGGTILSTAPHTPNPAKYPENPYVDLEPDEVYDYSDLTIKLRVPQDAHSFSFDFVYLTSEYPEFRCTPYNDTFVAMLTSEQYVGNVSFDAAGNTIQVNTALFVETDPAQLAGTGYDASAGGTSCFSLGGRPGCFIPPAGPCIVGGSTGWLTTNSPVTPGETIDLTFAIFDEGDMILDSTVLLDNFRWESRGAENPCTDPDGCRPPCTDPDGCP